VEYGQPTSNGNISGGIPEGRQVSRSAHSSFSTMTHLSRLCALLSAAFLLGIAFTAAPSLAQNVEVTIDETNSPVVEGENLTVDATAENTGDVSTDEDLSLQIDTTTVDQTTVTLGSGDSTQVTLTWSTESGDAGTPTATVESSDDSASVDVLVKAPFITIWDTENAGESADDQITIPGEGTSYQIIWEEVGNTSNTDTLTGTDDVTVTFPSPGLYRVKISGDFTRIHFGGDSGGDADKIELVTQWGDIEWSTMEAAFENASNLKVDADDTPDLSSVYTMEKMFSRASSITGESSSIESWNTGNIQILRSMFQEASSFDHDISEWNTSSVTDMSFMFDRANSFNGNIRQWDTGNVDTMRRMFRKADSFNQYIGEWDTGSVTDMRRMFILATSFNQHIGGWNVSNVTDMTSMFNLARSFNKDISQWDTGSVTDMSFMFRSAEAFNQDIGAWDVSSVADMTRMLTNASLSTVNYDRTLIGWAVQDLVGGVSLGATFDTRYCNSGPLRSHLIEEFGWTIEDDGQQGGCPEVLAASENDQVGDDGMFSFAEIPAELAFTDVLGSGRVTIVRYSDTPRNVGGISENNVSQYRIVVAGGGITNFSSVELRFPVDEYGGIDQPEEVTIYKRDTPGTGDFTALTTTVDDNSTPDDISDDTLSATTDSFSEFVFASDTNPLPVELAGFAGTATENGARLTWQTASETNNAGFEVHRQKENSWTQVGYVESKVSGGTTTETQSYSFAAEDLPVGTHQFRLKQVDLDGSSTLIDPVSVDIRMQEALRLTAPAPNPVSTSANLSFAVKERAETTITLYNTLGQQVATVFQGTPQAGEEQRARVDVSGLSSGTYFLRLRADGQTETRRVTVLR